MSLCSHFLHRTLVSRDGEGGDEKVTRELLSGVISGLAGGSEDVRVAEIAKEPNHTLK